MADPEFERGLARLFAQAPPAPDALLFVRRLEQRLDLRWTVRRLVIGLAAVGSALLGVRQLAGSSLAERVLAAAQAPLMLFEQRWRVLDSTAVLLNALPVPADVGWLVAGLVILAAGLAATRVMDEV